MCLHPQPKAGRCLDLPPQCQEGEENPACLPACEVHPPVGKLEAKAEWHWGLENVNTYQPSVDIWSTPVVGRLADTNCDGKVDMLDPPNIVFISGNVEGVNCNSGKLTNGCHQGVLRVLDGPTGKEIWSLPRATPTSIGFMGVSLALGDVDQDGEMEVVAITGEGYLALIDRHGKLKQLSDKPIPGSNSQSFGWGGGLAIADMNGDGLVEIAFGSTVFTTTNGKLTLKFTGKHGSAGSLARALSVFSDIDGDGQQELIAGNTVYKYDGSELWYNATLADGYPAIGDFDLDGKPEIALVYGGKLAIVEGKTGKLLAGPMALPGTGTGGAPTIADFDGDGHPEVGVAKATYYSVTKVNLESKSETDSLQVLWKQVNHDLSSSVTGSTVFDFEGDGSAEVIYNDECFLWVYDGKTGDVRFATPTNSFTATEASIAADIDGDGRVEMLMVANGADPTKWKCNISPWNTADKKLNRPAWQPPKGMTAHRGLTVWGDAHNRWVGSRMLWNQHSYHVSNICDSRDDLCDSAINSHGRIPARERHNWQVPWLNNFRQNVQDKGIFNAPDATVSLRVDCVMPITLRATVKNLGLALLPSGINVGIYRREGNTDTLLHTATTTTALFPGQGVELAFQPTSEHASYKDHFIAKILDDNSQPVFQECRTDNNQSKLVTGPCLLQ